MEKRKKELAQRNNLEVNKKTGSRKWKGKRACALFLAMLALFTCLATGCTKDEDAQGQEPQPLEYTVVEPDGIPENLMVQIEEQKQEGFKLTYMDGEEMYIAKGYGQQECSGYSIMVKELNLINGMIEFSTELVGPKNGENVSNEPSYPYIVVKTEAREQNVVFK